MNKQDICIIKYYFTLFCITSTSIYYIYSVYYFFTLTYYFPKEFQRYQSVTHIINDLTNFGFT